MKVLIAGENVEFLLILNFMWAFTTQQATSGQTSPTTLMMLSRCLNRTSWSRSTRRTSWESRSRRSEARSRCPRWPDASSGAWDGTRHPTSDRRITRAPPQLPQPGACPWKLSRTISLIFQIATVSAASLSQLYKVNQAVKPLHLQLRKTLSAISDNKRNG